MTDWEKELEAADARVKAAALRLSGGYQDEAKYYVSEAKAALAAADEVMFSDEAIERAARKLYEGEGGRWATCPDDLRNEWKDSVRATIAALKDDA